MIIKAVFIDFGGTLVHTPPNFSTETCIVYLHRNLMKNGISVSLEDCRKAYVEAANRFFSREHVREIRFGLVISEALNRLGYSLEPTSKVIIEAAEAYLEPWIQARTMDKQVPSVLRRLKTEYKLGVVSNLTYSPVVRKTLDRFGVSTIFDIIVVSADVGWRKPSPKIFKRALKLLKVEACESVFVGDELDHDIEGAQKVGMQTILLKKPSTRETRHKVEPDRMIHELKELPRALESLEAKTQASP